MWEGDYHCSKAEIKGMLRDAASETADTKILEHFDISVIATESFKGFRNHHKGHRPEHVFNNLPDDEYMVKIGAADLSEDGKLHPTTAGLLLFGEEYNIIKEFPEYFLDYREVLDPSIRWIDRLQSSSGDWSGNVFDFFFRVLGKITKDIKKPFKLDGIQRIDDTPVHKACKIRVTENGVPENNVFSKHFRIVGLFKSGLRHHLLETIARWSLFGSYNSLVHRVIIAQRLL